MIVLAPPSGFQDVPASSGASASSPSNAPRRAVGASAGGMSPSLPNISYPSQEDKEFDDSKCKHGKISVGEPELRGGKFTGHTVYRVSCAAGSVEHVFRRYSDFVWLRAVLSASFPGVFIPPLPPKQVIGNTNAAFVEGRRGELQRWLQRICVRAFLSEHEGVNLFLYRATAAYEEESKAMLKSAETRPPSEIVSLFSNLFPELLRIPRCDSQTESEMDTIKEFLNNSEKNLNAQVVQMDKMVGVQLTGVAELLKVVSLCQATFEQEKIFVERLPGSMSRSGVVQRIDLQESLVQWSMAMKWGGNSYEEWFLAPARFEHQDVQAMIEAVKSRNELSEKHKKSVKTAQKWTEAGKGPKNEKQEAQRQLDDAQARDEGALLELVTKLILHAQFETFWAFRMQQYKRRMHKFAKAQIEATTQLHATWTQIAAATTE